MIQSPDATTRERPPRIAFAGDRDIAVAVLDDLLAAGGAPLALLVSAPDRATHAAELRARCPRLADDHVLEGAAFRSPAGMALLQSLDLDLIVAVHFPYIVPQAVLEIPREGVLNLHPAYLPYNRGWHTPSWAILDGTPAGATLHFMDAGIDTGDIVHQRRLDVAPDDTAHTLYERLKHLEREVFREAWPHIASGRYSRRRQTEQGTAHVRRDLLSREVQEIDLDAPTSARELLRRLRALTTNRLDEAAWFRDGGSRYAVQVSVRCIETNAAGDPAGATRPLDSDAGGDPAGAAPAPGSDAAGCRPALAGARAEEGR